ncbi:hypothetical protein KGM_203458 [Danaus plexippus plexippus]|uniref:Uncharacterized protein n=1 Tax=Danaus plexippus plexippus TaxID=278856 RepID=A0A212F5X4_DANPL|nr:hypothetical protein KGM_203458 [Danaus plexippus plexippus]
MWLEAGADARRKSIIIFGMDLWLTLTFPITEHVRVVRSVTPGAAPYLAVISERVLPDADSEAPLPTRDDVTGAENPSHDYSSGDTKTDKKPDTAV